MPGEHLWMELCRGCPGRRWFAVVREFAGVRDLAGHRSFYPPTFRDNSVLLFTPIFP